MKNAPTIDTDGTGTANTRTTDTAMTGIDVNDHGTVGHDTSGPENVTETVPVAREEVRIEREPITDADIGRIN